MRIIMLSVLFSLFLSGCAGKEGTIESKLTVEPYELSVKEVQLVSKTGAGSIEYFKLNGKIDKGDVLLFSLETRKNGEVLRDEIKSQGDYIGTYKDELISFGTSAIGSEKDTLNLLIGGPSELVREEQPNKVAMHAMCKTIDEKITLKKEIPVYLAMWEGTDGESLNCVTTENGELPKSMAETDIAYLYKVLWTNED